jgi:hypothetical protein
MRVVMKRNPYDRLRGLGVARVRVIHPSCHGERLSFPSITFRTLFPQPRPPAPLEFHHPSFPRKRESTPASAPYLRPRAI